MQIEFCWLCNGAWKDHGEKTGGYYACNKYEKMKKSGTMDSEESERESAKSVLEHYLHYYKRWQAHDGIH
jgi:ariadne-1